jgi:hypothetical protein
MHVLAFPVVWTVGRIPGTLLLSKEGQAIRVALPDLLRDPCIGTDRHRPRFYLAG